MTDKGGVGSASKPGTAGNRGNFVLLSSMKERLTGVHTDSVLRSFFAALVLLGFVAFMPTSADAGVIASAGPTFPLTVTVGETGRLGSVTLENRNTTPNVGDTNTVCNAGEASPPCSSPERGIVLVPSCTQLAGGQCTAAGADPGVFQLSATGLGKPGTACAGMTFGITMIDPTFGTVRFTPQPAGAHVTLPGFGSSCVIDFTFDVLRSPTSDQDPATPGTQTAQATENTQFAGIFGEGALSNFARGTSNGTTVLRAASTSIATTASPDIVLGAGTLLDNATVSGRVNPVAGATIDFRLYGPGDATCSGTPVFQPPSVPYPAAGGSVASATFTPTLAGTYRWVATYSGDANNAPSAGACNAANETTVVARPTPAIATTASAGVTLGTGQVTDTAVVTGRVNPLAGATVDFRLYGPNDATCTGTPAFQAIGLPYPVAGGPVTSGPFTPPAAGTYRWTASYSGDANNAPVVGACNAANESVVVASQVTTTTNAPATTTTTAPPAVLATTTTTAPVGVEAVVLLPRTGSGRGGLLYAGIGLLFAGLLLVGVTFRRIKRDPTG